MKFDRIQELTACLLRVNKNLLSINVSLAEDFIYVEFDYGLDKQTKFSFSAESSILDTIDSIEEGASIDDLIEDFICMHIFRQNLHLFFDGRIDVEKEEDSICH